MRTLLTLLAAQVAAAVLLTAASSTLISTWSAASACMRWGWTAWSSWSAAIATAATPPRHPHPQAADRPHRPGTGGGGRAGRARPRAPVGLGEAAALAQITRLIDQQACTRAADDISLASALIFLALIGLVWLRRRPAPIKPGAAPVDASAAH